MTVNDVVRPAEPLATNQSPALMIPLVVMEPILSRLRLVSMTVVPFTR